MKKVIALLVLGLCFGACTEVYFEQSQPAGIKPETKFPIDIQGTYVTNDEDTIRIGEVTYNADDEDESIYSQGKINDKVILKKYKKIYYLSVLQDNGLWEVAALSVGKDKELTSYYIDGGNEFSVDKMRSIVTIQEVFDPEGDIDYYIINPNKNQLKRLFSNEVFTKVGSIRKIE